MPRCRENEAAVFVAKPGLNRADAKPVEMGKRLRGKGHAMLAAVPCPGTGKCPDAGVKINLAPFHARHFFAAGSG
jgi:hypothetical protein